ncbi:unannotated protein [freshwater metagenome]|uniref:Unannotated protein n=1 Tax=freshwater metagenome TaxID=449393 RepID=A0A6J7KBW0_9ZZZZ
MDDLKRFRDGLRSRPPSIDLGLDVAAWRTPETTACDTPSITLSVTLPVKPSVTITSALPEAMSLPSTLPTHSMCGWPASRSRRRRWTSTTSAVPFVGSSPFESSATRGRRTPRTVRASAAPMKPNCTR